MRELVRYFFKMVCMALAVAGSFLLMFACLLGGMDQRSDTIAGTTPHKVDLLQQTESPRIILVGGSSSPYGTNCQMIADELGVSTINVGATAYQGLEFYLTMLRTYAAEGDVIVFAPEWMQMQEDMVDYQQLWIGAGTDWDVWRCVPLSYYPGLFTNAMKYYDWLKEVQTMEGILSYHRQFGPLGDVIEQRVSIIQEPGGCRGVGSVLLNTDTPSERLLNKIARFAKTMQKRGATVLFAFAPLNRPALAGTAEEHAAYEALITESVGMPVILGLEQSVMDPGYFYDTDNHLNTAGAAIYTQNLIEGLRPYIQ